MGFARSPFESASLFFSPPRPFPNPSHFFRETLNNHKFSGLSLFEQPRNWAFVRSPFVLFYDIEGGRGVEGKKKKREKGTKEKEKETHESLCLFS